MKNYKVELDYKDWITLISIIGTYSGIVQGVLMSLESGEKSKNIANEDANLSRWSNEIRDKAILKES